MNTRHYAIIIGCLLCALSTYQCAATRSGAATMQTGSKNILATGSLYAKGSTIPLDLKYHTFADYALILYTPFGQTIGSLVTRDSVCFITHLDRTDTASSRAPTPALEAFDFSPSLSAIMIGRIVAHDWHPLTTSFDSLVVQGPERIQWKWVDEHRFKFTFMKGVVTEVEVDSSGKRLWRASYQAKIQDFPRRIRIAGPDNDYFTLNFTRIKSSH